MASALAVDSQGRFQPPRWCRPPRDGGASSQSVRFLAEDAPGAERVRQGEEVCIAEKAVYKLGRADAGVDIRLRGESASRLHAAICQDVDGKKFLVDLRSTQGTFLGGRRLEPYTPVRWPQELRATFGCGPTADVLELAPAGGDGADGAARDDGSEATASTAKRPRTDDASAGGASPSAAAVDPMLALYGDLPEATVTQVAPRLDEKRRPEPLPPPSEPTRIIFLDIDGVLRSVHGRTDVTQNVRTMVVEGQRVALMGDMSNTNDNLAGIDFWPQAMRALKYIVQKTQAAVVLSSDWRKQESLVQGINNQMGEYGMPKLYGQTPDLSATTGIGVVKALHSNVREKRAKEIRKWLRTHPKITRYVAIDDMDLSPNRRDELLHQQSGSAEPMPFLDMSSDFVKCNPAVGLTMDLAKLAIALLNGGPVSDQELDRAYGRSPQEGASAGLDPSFQGLGPSTFIG
mmetsp:Transcript_113567/g.315967  ORF Transcript_113567/g.315967 Transcript_113567/m.315967 type:complete len:460 (-) Transcript_113567:50-1429(-)